MAANPSKLAGFYLDPISNRYYKIPPDYCQNSKYVEAMSSKAEEVKIQEDKKHSEKMRPTKSLVSVLFNQEIGSTITQTVSTNYVNFKLKCLNYGFLRNANHIFVKHTQLLSHPDKEKAVVIFKECPKNANRANYFEASSWKAATLSVSSNTEDLIDGVPSKKVSGSGKFIHRNFFQKITDSCWIDLPDDDHRVVIISENSKVDCVKVPIYSRQNSQSYSLPGDFSSHFISSCCWNRQHERLYYATQGGIYSQKLDSPMQIFDEICFVRSLTCTKDGNGLYFGCDRSKGIYFTDLRVKKRNCLIGGLKLVSKLHTLADDNSLLFSSSGILGVLDVRNQRIVKNFIGNHDPFKVQSLSFDERSDMVCSVSESNTINIWKLSTGKLHQVLSPVRDLKLQKRDENETIGGFPQVCLKSNWGDKNCGLFSGLMFVYGKDVFFYSYQT